MRPVGSYVSLDMGETASHLSSSSIAPADHRRVAVVEEERGSGVHRGDAGHLVVGQGEVEAPRRPPRPPSQPVANGRHAWDSARDERSPSVRDHRASPKVADDEPPCRALVHRGTSGQPRQEKALADLAIYQGFLVAGADLSCDLRL